MLELLSQVLFVMPLWGLRLPLCDDEQSVPKKSRAEYSRVTHFRSSLGCLVACPRPRPRLHLHPRLRLRLEACLQRDPKGPGVRAALSLFLRANMAGLLGCWRNGYRRTG